MAARPKVEAGAPIFVRSPGLAPVLPLAAGPSAMARLEETSYRAVFWEGVQRAQEATFNDEDLGSTFKAAVAGAGF